jgi:hypothetical protein
VAYWLEDLDVEDRLSRTTRLLYERNMRTLVLPAFENLIGNRHTYALSITDSVGLGW